MHSPKDCTTRDCTTEDCTTKDCTTKGCIAKDYTQASLPLLMSMQEEALGQVNAVGDYQARGETLGAKRSA